MTANLGLSILGVVMALAGVVVGPLLDRYSIRAFMVVGALLNGLAFAAMSQATELWHLAVLFGGCVAVGVAMFGPLAANTVVAKWFDKYRGRAVGIASMGPPTGGLILAVASGWLMESYGWRATLWCFPGCTCWSFRRYGSWCVAVLKTSASCRMVKRPVRALRA